VTAALALSLALAACGGGDDEADSTTTSTASTGSTTTTAISSSTATDDEGSSSTTDAVVLGDEPTFADSGPSGSGCTPGASDLPDGWWYGTTDQAVADNVELDLACYYVGPAGEAEAASRGDELTNDYYVVNDNPAVRSVPVAPGATASCVEMEPSLNAVDCAPGDVAGDWAIWIRVRDGQVDRIVEQFAP
jgi:hypothetical protein